MSALLEIARRSSSTRAFGRALTRATAVLFLLFFATRVAAEDVAVPLKLQAQLVAKVAEYDRAFLNRAGQRAQILILVKPDNNESSRAGSQMLSGLTPIPWIGGLPHDDFIMTYSTSADLVETCKRRGVAIVYVAPGFASELEAIREALDGVDILTVSSVVDYVPKGIVLGFDLVSGNPKLLVNMGQAKRQHVQFKSDLLKLARIYE